MRIAVIGCGAAGAAAGVFLKRAGHAVTVFEQAPESRAVGAGFLMQPTGMDVLRELGIYDEVVSHASQVSRLHVLENALPEYSRRRGPSLRYYQFATRWLTPVFQSDLEWISPFRHGCFRVSQRIPFVRKMMTRSMAGMMRAI
jgi:2-polyprenyl-6-methoxyphenol hydroxylase-like FAD-dependent oxidoreductase